MTAKRKLWLMAEEEALTLSHDVLQSNKDSAYELITCGFILGSDFRDLLVDFLRESDAFFKGAVK
jgi:hypothetical protein